MDKPSYHEKIISLLQDTWYKLGEESAWIPSYKVMMCETPLGWVGSSGHRRADELVQNGKIEKRINDGIAEYRWKYQPNKLF